MPKVKSPTISERLAYAENTKKVLITAAWDLLNCERDLKEARVKRNKARERLAEAYDRYSVAP